MLTEIKAYFTDHPDIEAEWRAFYQQMKQEKAEYGYEKTTIVDVWNVLESRYSGGKIRRPFFNAFYFTNPTIFAILKKLL